MAVELQKIKEYQTMPVLKSTDTDWIKWSDSVIGKYGSDLGNQIFIGAWQKRGSRAANTYALRDHLKKKYNITIDETAWDKIVDVGGGVGKFVGNAFKVGKWTLIIGGGIALIAIGMITYNKIKGK